MTGEAHCKAFTLRQLATPKGRGPGNVLETGWVRVSSEIRKFPLLSGTGGVKWSDWGGGGSGCKKRQRCR